MSKMRNKGPKSKIAPARKLDAPMFLYFSVCCNVKASKPALLKTPEAEGTLGKFRCGNCDKRCKVQRIKCQDTKTSQDEPLDSGV
jgi:hypothetical protein